MYEYPNPRYCLGRMQQICIQGTNFGTSVVPNYGNSSQFRCSGVMSLLYFSVGLNGAPFHADYSIAKWTDTSTSALPSLKYMGFTAGICTVFGTLFSYIFFLPQG